MDQSVVEDLIGGMPSWTEEANCKGADAVYFSPKEEPLRERQKLYVELVQFKMNALSMQSNNQKSLVFGVAFQREREGESKDRELLNLMLEM